MSDKPLFGRLYAHLRMEFLEADVGRGSSEMDFFVLEVIKDYMYKVHDHGPLAAVEDAKDFIVGINQLEDRDRFEIEARNIAQAVVEFLDVLPETA